MPEKAHVSSVEALESFRADVVIVDARLAACAGVELCRRLRAEALLPHLKLLLLVEGPSLALRACESPCENPSLALRANEDGSLAPRAGES